ncbi:MAG: Putative competence-damage inducible protein [Holosporales bacterium]
MEKSSLTAAILVIGDEILSGRTQDTNVRTIAKRLLNLGIDLKEVRIIPDDENEIIDAVNILREKYTYLFTTGGIGATHDDITMPSIAKAFGRKVVINEEASAAIVHHYGDHINDIRMRMAYMPENVKLIQNPVSGVPTFYIENVFVLAGMPSVMVGMFDFVENILEKGQKILTNTITSSVVEGVMAKDLEAIQKNFETVSIGSYPFYDYPNIGASIVLRSRDADHLKKATEVVFSMLISHGGTPQTELEVDFKGTLNL